MGDALADVAAEDGDALGVAVVIVTDGAAVAVALGVPVVPVAPLEHPASGSASATETRTTLSRDAVRMGIGLTLL